MRLVQRLQRIRLVDCYIEGMGGYKTPAKGESWGFPQTVDQLVRQEDKDDKWKGTWLLDDR